MPNHAINKQVFDFTCSNEWVAKKIRYEFVHFTSVEINRLINDVLAEHDAENRNLFIDTIEIDLGDVSRQQFGDHDMLTRFRTLLSEKILAIQHENRATANGTGQPVPAFTVNLSILESFILHGDIPWWVDKSASVDPDKLIRELAAANPRAVKLFLEKHQDNPAVLSRITTQYKPATQAILQTLCGFKPPSPAVLLLEKHRQSSKTSLMHLLSGETAMHAALPRLYKPSASDKKKKALVGKLPGHITPNMMETMISLGLLSADEAAAMSTFLASGSPVNQPERKALAEMLSRLSLSRLRFIYWYVSAGSVAYEYTQEETRPSAPQGSMPQETETYSTKQTGITGGESHLGNNSSNAGIPPSTAPLEPRHAENGNDPAHSRVDQSFSDHDENPGAYLQKDLPGRDQSLLLPTKGRYNTDGGQAQAGVLPENRENPVPPYHAPADYNSDNSQATPGFVPEIKPEQVRTSLPAKPGKGDPDRRDDGGLISPHPSLQHPARNTSTAEAGALFQTTKIDGDEGAGDATLPMPGGADYPGNHHLENQVITDVSAPGTLAENTVPARVTTAGAKSDLHNVVNNPIEAATGPGTKNTALPGTEQVVNKQDFIANKPVAALMSGMGSTSRSLFNYLQTLPPPLLDQLRKIVLAGKRENVAHRKLVNKLLEHPQLLQYSLLPVFASVAIPGADEPLVLPGVETNSLPVKKEKELRSLVDRIRSAQTGFKAVLKDLSWKETIILQDILAKKTTSSSEKSLLKKVLLRLPADAVRFMLFLAGQPDSELAQLQTVEARGLPGFEQLQEHGDSPQYSDDNAKKIYIANAGLCLVAPYLSGLFRNLGYTEKSVFKNKAVHTRSLYLLQYMATGKPSAPEYLLQLNKLLCGYDLEKPIALAVRLTRREKTEADMLIESVVANWKALRNTSVQGFRESFLQRKGILFQNDMSWTLQVEKLGHDLLLDTIPWGFNMIKLPWMKKMVQVEW